MNAAWLVVAIFACALIALVFWGFAQNRKKGEQFEGQINELRRDLLGLTAAQTQSSTKMETIAESVATRLENVTRALQDGVKDSAQITSQITSQAQSAMSSELKNTREQINQIQKQLGEVQQAGVQMHRTAEKLESILGNARARGSFGEVTLERLLEDCLAAAQYATQFRFRGGETADAVVFLRDGKLMAVDSKFPLDAYLRLGTEGEEARKAFATAVKNHADSIARKYILPSEGTLDVALMFVPSEVVYYELLMTNDTKGVALDAYCRSRNILPVSPNTLYAHLSVIAMGLRGMQIEENAKRLAENLAGVRKQLEGFSEHFGKIGTHLKNAQQSYTEADKRFDKASNTLDTLLSGGAETAAPALEDAQGALELPPPTVKRSA